ncbi:MAG: hypothetical protein IJ692_07340 [Alloprevotella sp.]|nr:hypothetical protein [Alloprevotella sp.]MBR1653178.1 hypothetical protein [Alloprevotella sp.]
MKHLITLAACALLAAALPLALTSCGGDKDEDDPKVDVQSITPTKMSLELTEGDEPYALPYLVQPTSATDKSVTAVSSDEKVCTVRPAAHDELPATETVTGYVDVQPVGEGTATVTITSRSNPDVKSTVTVTVKAAEATAKQMDKVGFNITLPDQPRKMFGPTGGSVDARAGTSITASLVYLIDPLNIFAASIDGARWESSNTSVATVASAVSSRENTITLRSAGTARIVVTAPDGSQSSFTLNVAKASVNSRFAITGADGKKYLLTGIVDGAMYNVEYDESGELKTIAGMERLSDGRYRDGDCTLSLTFKSGTPLVTKLEYEKEASLTRYTGAFDFTYDSSNRLVKVERTFAQNGTTYRRDATTYTWNSEKLLNTSLDIISGSAYGRTLTYLYGGNKANPQRRMGIMPVVADGILSIDLGGTVCAALAALGCFGQGPAVLPTGYSYVSEVGGKGSLSVACTLDAAGLLMQEEFSEVWNNIALLKYQYEAQ